MIANTHEKNTRVVRVAAKASQSAKASQKKNLLSLQIRSENFGRLLNTKWRGVVKNYEGEHATFIHRLACNATFATHQDSDIKS